MTPLQMAQRRHESSLPAEPDVEWLETADGANWLDCAATDLLKGHSLQIGRRTPVEVSELDAAVAAEAVRRFQAGDDGMLGQLLLAVDNFDMGAASSCLKSLFHDTRSSSGSVFHAYAVDLIKPHADDAREQMIRDAEADAIDMKEHAA